MSRPTPFDEGAASVLAGEKAANPFEEGSVEFKNFELGRTYAIENKDGASPFGARPPEAADDAQKSRRKT